MGKGCELIVAEKPNWKLISIWKLYLIEEGYDRGKDRFGKL